MQDTSTDPCDRSVKRASETFSDEGMRANGYLLVQKEANLDLRVQDATHYSIACSPFDLEDLAVGRLFTDGIIAHVSDIKSIICDEEALTVCVTLSDEQMEALKTPSPLPPIEPRNVRANDVYLLAELFAMDGTSHGATHGTHSAYLAYSKAGVCIKEDIGRHNAFDKVVGWALRHHIDLAQSMLFTSGRVPVDMVIKAIRATIPTLISKTVATDQAIDLARAHGLTLICNALPTSFEVVAGSDRIR